MNEWIIIGVALLLLISVLASKISDRFGVPALLLFLVLGMLAGSDGLGGIYFDDPALAQAIGVVALVLILFSGGLDTEWSQVRSVMKEGLLLATLGVFLTAVVLGLCAAPLLGFTWLEGLLLGAIVSSTDAAAVFSVLRSRGVSLKGKLKPLLELESGSNDPMAIFLTLGLIQWLTRPEFSPSGLLVLFVQQMGIGAVLGYGMGKIMVFLINRIRLGYEGLYPVLTLALVFLTFGLAAVLGGSGFLAVYLAGIVLAQQDFIHKRSLMRFHDGLAWLMQITMFLTLGLLVFPSRLVPIAKIGMMIALILMFLARPLGVFISLLPSRLGWREKVFISWVGLRGAVPIILATFPLLARVSHADLIFNIIFFVVLTSVLLQGTSIPIVARWLNLDMPAHFRRTYPIEFTPVSGIEGELKELILPADSPAVGKAIVDLGLPAEFLIVLIARGKEFIIPSGGTVLQGRDTLLVLTDKPSLDQACARLGLKGEARPKTDSQ
ncbi:potassium/proton antiporter [uncultured Thermanaerothrix sp.]|uniref:potassium/proton antiporter n=1 Tax=uncultured Thermanaerothrix sp. TaxID=1195149 RepID=UPI00260BD681|nr:potassium/proton antiporter [uncultured Thermanaerothrix sp.]